MAEPRLPPIWLILCLIVTSSSSSSHDQNFQVLDVASSLQLTRQVFSPKHRLPHANSPVQHLNPLDFGNHSADSLSITLHPRYSLPFIDSYDNNYTSITLYRLARDEAHVRSLLSRNSHSRSRHSHAHLKHSRPAKKALPRPEQLESPVISGLRQGSGEYFARIGVGRPAEEFYMVIDSGSDVIWLQCEPCSDCYHQSDPIFNPSASTTYRPLPCASAQCNALEVSACLGDSCMYGVSYGDGSYTVGDFATETISFGRTGSVPNVAIGCGRDNEGLFSGAAGLLGIGGGPLSLPSQIRATSFSYCLVNRDSSSSSSLEFNSAQPPDAVLAPLLRNSLMTTFRYVALTGVSVGGRPVPISPSLFRIGRDGRGGVIVDSGTAVTRFRTEVYNPLRDTFRSLSQNLPRAAGFSLLDTCYDLSFMSTVRVPTVSFQFSGGKTLPLPPRNYLIPVNDRGKFCFAFAGTSGSLSIIGNVQQQGTRVSYNLAGGYIGFSPNKC